MRIYLINLNRRPDRLAAMTARAQSLGLTLERIEAVDAATVEPEELERWFTDRGPLGEIPAGDKACLLSHRRAWERFLATSDANAVFLEDDVVLSPAAGELLRNDSWVRANVAAVKLEHYGPKGQRVLLSDRRAVAGGFQTARMLSRHTGAAAYILSRRATDFLMCQPRFSLPVDHLLFNPNNSPLFDALAPLQLLPAIARQEQFVGAKSDIEGTRVSLRQFSGTYVKRELTRFGYDLRLLPRQLAALARGARFVEMTTTQ